MIVGLKEVLHIRALLTQWQNSGVEMAGRWTIDELEFLKVHYAKYGAEFCAEHLKRTPESIRKQAYYRGLKFELNQSEIMKQLHKKGKMLQSSETRSASTKKAWQNHPHPKGYLGKTHNSETRKKISQKSKEAWGNPESKFHTEEFRQLKSDNVVKQRQAGKLQQCYSRAKRGRREDIGDYYFRSSWEANYARYLNYLVAEGKIYKWEFESDTFWFENIRRGIRSYTPDFKIWDTQESEPYYVEVKGYMDNKSKTKIKRFLKYYPHLTLKLVEKDFYRRIINQYSGKIEGWE
jgi:hypothetical protein